MLGCWVVCLAAGRIIYGPENGPIAGVAMLLAWQAGMIVLHTNGKDVVVG